MTQRPGSRGSLIAKEGLDTDEQVTSAVALGDALNGVKDTVGGACRRHADAATAASGGYTEEQTKAIDSVLKWGGVRRRLRSRRAVGQAPRRRSSPDKLPSTGTNSAW